MKVKLYLPKTFDIPDDQLERLAKLARIRGRRPRSNRMLRGSVDVDEIISEAIHRGVIDPGDDFSYGHEEDRILYRGQLITQDEAVKLFHEIESRKSPL